MSVLHRDYSLFFTAMKGSRLHCVYGAGNCLLVIETNEVLGFLNSFQKHQGFVIDNIQPVTSIYSEGDMLLLAMIRGSWKNVLANLQQVNNTQVLSIDRVLSSHVGEVVAKQHVK